MQSISHTHSIERRRHSVVLAFAAGFLLSVGFAPAQETARADKPVKIKSAEDLQQNIAKVDAIFDALHAKQGFGSVTVGIVSGADLVWTRSYGLADIDKKIPATRDTVYRLGSITKEFTAVMLWQLVAHGKVHLSDPVQKYFPEIGLIPTPYPEAPPITLVQLATHTAGLAEEPDDIQTYTTGRVADWEKTLIAALPHTTYKFEPGTRYSYSNIGYAILGAALERAAGKPYTEYVQKNVLEPLGMGHTAFEATGEVLRNVAKGYVVRNGSADPSLPEAELKNGRGYKVPNGALFTTVGDLARFISFQMGDARDNAVLGRLEVKEAMSRVYSADSALQAGYGLGFRATRLDRGAVVLGHNGAVAGYMAGAMFDPRTHLGLVVFNNAIGSETIVQSEMAALQALVE